MPSHKAAPHKAANDFEPDAIVVGSGAAGGWRRTADDEAASGELAKQRSRSLVLESPGEYRAAALRPG